MGSIFQVFRETTSVAEVNRPSAVAAVTAQTRRCRLIAHPRAPWPCRAASGLAGCAPERQRRQRASGRAPASVPFLSRLALRVHGIHNNRRLYKRLCRLWHFRSARSLLLARRSRTVLRPRPAFSPKRWIASRRSATPPASVAPLPRWIAVRVFSWLPLARLRDRVQQSRLAALHDVHRLLKRRSQI